jgi:spermidine/putrescine transport system permease protein
MRMQLRTFLYRYYYVLPCIPLLAFLVLFLIYPLVVSAALSFQGVEWGTFKVVWVWNFDNYYYIFSQWHIVQVYLITLLYAILATAILLAIAYPVAYTIGIVIKSDAVRFALITIVLFPLFLSDIVRVYAQLVFFYGDGLLNYILTSIGLITYPIDFLHTQGIVLFALVYHAWPFMIFPLELSIVSIDPLIFEAAQNLGARRWATFREMLLPLSAPGAAIGAILSFVLCLGAYEEPTFLAGKVVVFVSELIEHNFGWAMNWPLGSAMAMVFIAVMIVCVLVLLRATKLETTFLRRR